MDVVNLTLWVLAAMLLVMLVRASVKIVSEYERGVIFRLGRA